MIKRMDDDLEIEKTKRNALEQYGRREMLEFTGIPHEDGESCIYSFLRGWNPPPPFWENPPSFLGTPLFLKQVKKVTHLFLFPNVLRFVL